MLSMTGYVKRDFKIKPHNLSIIIKSLNSHKGIDISIKTPYYLTHFDSEIRQLVERELIRGKIDVKIMENSKDSNILLNKRKLLLYINSIKKIMPEADSGSILNAALKLPDIFIPEKFKIGPDIKSIFLINISKALRQLIKDRSREGRLLRKDIKIYIYQILKISKQLVLLDKSRIKNKKHKILNNIKNNIKISDYSPARLESEMIYYFEKNDITEERIRLQHHCNFFLDVISKEKVMGKKLLFIAQEILREINTIGSKAHNFEIQKRVVLMKEEIEKTKEQLYNIL